MLLINSYIASIKTDASLGIRDSAISEKVFLTLLAAAFEADPHLSYRIRKATVEKLAVPITRVHMSGSAALGVSPQKSTPYASGTSDIGLVIIDERWFARMLEAAQTATRGYTESRESTKMLTE